MVPELNIQDLTVPEPNCQDGGFRPLDALTKSHSLIRKRPPGSSSPHPLIEFHMAHCLPQPFAAAPNLPQPQILNKGSYLHFFFLMTFVYRVFGRFVLRGVQNRD
jgi:hypothetical protein